MAWRSKFPRVSENTVSKYPVPIHSSSHLGKPVSHVFPFQNEGSLHTIAVGVFREKVENLSFKYDYYGSLGCKISSCTLSPTSVFQLDLNTQAKSSWIGKIIYKNEHLNSLVHSDQKLGLYLALSRPKTLQKLGPCMRVDSKTSYQPLLPKVNKLFVNVFTLPANLQNWWQNHHLVFSKYQSFRLPLVKIPECLWVRLLHVSCINPPSKTPFRRSERIQSIWNPQLKGYSCRHL